MDEFEQEQLTREARRAQIRAHFDELVAQDNALRLGSVAPAAQVMVDLVTPPVVEIEPVEVETPEAEPEKPVKSVKRTSKPLGDSE